MTQDALRTPYSAETTRIHLVYSRSWQVASLKKPVASVRPTLQPVPAPTPQTRRSRIIETLLLAAAALTAPLVWVGHVVLHLMKSH